MIGRVDRGTLSGMGYRDHTIPHYEKTAKERRKDASKADHEVEGDRKVLALRLNIGRLQWFRAREAWLAFYIKFE